MLRVLIVPAQRNQVLIIDTLLGQRQAFEVFMHPIKNEFVYADSVLQVDIQTAYPQVICRFSLPDSLMYLRLALDDSGGYLVIKNTREIMVHDTLRINKFTVYHNNLKDSVSLSLAWYWKDSSGIKLIESKNKVWYEKHKKGEGPFPRKSAELVINGTVMRITFGKKASTGSFTVYHGYPKMKGNKKMAEYEMLRNRVNNKETGERYKYFAAEVAIYKLTWVAGLK
jgi:hypothetical protein